MGEAKAASKKRGRVHVGSQRGEEDGSVWEWRWGPRAMSEVGEADVARFVVEFMTETAAREEYETDEELMKAKENMMKGIERASGGSLAEIC